MVTLKGTSKNGQIILEKPLPPNLEGKQLEILIIEEKPTTKKRRQSGSAKGQILISPDFDEPLEDFEGYMP
ncbi:MAG: DUF2281 domain-containing protein [Crocosphaera sp.]